jgi:hypothetical protein
MPRGTMVSMSMENSSRAAGGRRSRGAVQACLGPLPAQEDVAGCLHQPLARDYALAWLVFAGADEGGQDRLVCLLELQEQRMRVVTAKHQDDPAAGSDAADLATHGDELELLEQEPAVGFQRASVLGDQVLQLRLEGCSIRFDGQQLCDRKPAAAGQR